MHRPSPRTELTLLSLLVALPIGCGASPTPAPEATASPTPGAAPPPPASAPAKLPLAAPASDANLIPRETLFGNPEKAAPQISPDGKWIAYLAPVSGVLNVVVAPLSDPTKSTPATHDTARPITFFTWTRQPNVLIYLQDTKGDENFHVYAVTLPDGAPKDLTPYPNIQADPHDTSARHPDEVVIGMNDRDPKYHDVYRVNLKTGARTLVQKNDGYRGYLLDDDFKVHLGVKSNPDGGKTYFAPSAKKEFDVPYFTVAFEDMSAVAMYGFDDKGKTIYMLDGRGRDTVALVAMDAATKKVTVLAEDPRSDVTTGLADPKTHRPLLAMSEYDRRRLFALDPSWQPDLDYLKTVVPGADFGLYSCTDDLKRCIAQFVVSDGPGRYYVYDRAAHKATFLFSDNSKLEGLPLAKMLPVTIPSRDGLPLVSYLTLPKGSDADGDGKPDHALPMVLYVHGGPWGRDEWGYDPDHQWLANRGYAVLSVNYRGSTGFGKKFVNAGNLEWAGKMHDDLVDAVGWAIKAGIADEKKVAIYGGSYGGYATLVGMTFTPDTFACGVDICGPSDLVTFEQTIPPYWANELETLAKRVGDFRTEEGKKLLESRSPLTHASAITRPLLIGQGANDPRVKQAESDQIVKSMQARGIPVSYLLFSDEGHGFNRPENSKAFRAVQETFLAQCLGGKYQPVGDDFKGSTIAAVAGADKVYGLEDALRQPH
ncbi:MAG TPA: S9 family peptidase [Polyangiaceae bacterium]|nr:S9 family peptidase [Polyangiaceae bacterium]